MRKYKYSFNEKVQVQKYCHGFVARRSAILRSAGVTWFGLLGFHWIGRDEIPDFLWIRRRKWRAACLVYFFLVYLTKEKWLFNKNFYCIVLSVMHRMSSIAKAKGYKVFKRLSRGKRPQLCAPGCIFVKQWEGCPFIRLSVGHTKVQLLRNAIFTISRSCQQKSIGCIKRSTASNTFRMTCLDYSEASHSRNRFLSVLNWI